jgi:hypothetical protein
MVEIEAVGKGVGVARDGGKANYEPDDGKCRNMSF